MKQKFNKNWKSSKQPRKQRKYRANAPLSVKKKFVNVNLSKELRTKYGTRNIQVRKGDKVKIMRGKFKGNQGKITTVKLKTSKVTVENIQVKKLDGSKANVFMQPSNLQIIELNLEDKKRIKKLDKKNNSKKDTKKKLIEPSIETTKNKSSENKNKEKKK